MHYSVFQSHEPEFDFLKSLEIESKINQLKFCHPVGDNIFMLSTNGNCFSAVLPFSSDR